MGKFKAPKAPDPYATADAQAQANKDAAIATQQLSFVNQNTPYGSLQYKQIGTYPDGTPRYSAKQTLGESEAALKGITDKTALGLGQQYYDQYVGANQGGTPQGVYDSLINRAQPQFDRSRDQIETRLANQGITDTGSEAYKSAIDEYNRGYNDFLLGAGTQRYGLEADQRTRALNELLGIATGTQVNPGYVSTPSGGQVGAAPISDSIYANYNAQNANAAGNRQGLYSLVGSAFGAAGQAAGGGFKFSDFRLKRNVERIGALPSGLDLYRYQYIWGGPEQVGVIAQEAEKVFPNAVRQVGGYLAVNYAEVS